MQMKPESVKVVFVTGASSGIGRAIAMRFAQSGHIVYGTTRKTVPLPSDTPDGFTMLQMDVRSDDSIAKAVALIHDTHGHIDILIANAGTGVAGAVEDMSLEQAQAQFETNYFGTLRTIRAVLPLMRKQQTGCIVGVSSVAALLPIPFQAGYSATKAAMEATLIALRGEVRPYGLRVSLVEPGDTRTGFTDAREKADRTVANSPYQARVTRSLARMERDERNGVSPEKVAQVLFRVATRKNPPVRVAVGMDYRFLLLLRRLLPDRLVQWFLERMYAS